MPNRDFCFAFMTRRGGGYTAPTHKIDSRNAAQELTPAPPREGICVSLCMSSLPVSSLCYEMTLLEFTLREMTLFEYTLYEMTLCEVTWYEFTMCEFTLSSLCMRSLPVS